MNFSCGGSLVAYFKAFGDPFSQKISIIKTSKSGYLMRPKWSDYSSSNLTHIRIYELVTFGSDIQLVVYIL